MSEGSEAFAATCKACKEIVLTSVGFFVGDSVGFFVGDSVGFFVGDCRKGIAARQGVRDERGIKHLQQRARHAKRLYSPPWGSSSAIRSGSSSATRSDSSWETAGRASQHVKASEMRHLQQRARHAKRLYSPPWGSSSAIRSGSSSATRSDSSWETAGRASQHVKASEMSEGSEAFAATCKACKEIVLTSVGFFVGDSVGFFVGDSVGFFVGDCRKGIAARQGVRDERGIGGICSNLQGMQRDCTHLRGVLRRRFGRVLRRRLGRILRGRLQEGHRSTSRRQR